jgi:hypothetical protein
MAHDLYEFVGFSGETRKTGGKGMDDYRQLPQWRQRHAVASYVLIVLAIIVGMGLGVFAATWLWPH